MGLNKTQCPHCFTTYVISDEQFRVSEGMVRCGTCRERFQARLIGSTPGSPRFDPRDAFIEPLSEEPVPTTTEPAPQITKIEFTNPPTEPIQQSTGFSRHSLEESLTSEVSIDLGDDDAQIKETHTDNHTESENVETPSVAVVLAGIKAQRKRTKQDTEPESANPLEKEPVKPKEKANNVEAKQAELELPLRDSRLKSDASPAQRDDPIDAAVKQGGKSQKSTSTHSEAQLIDQVDNLIKHKILTPKPSTARTQKTRHARSTKQQVKPLEARATQSKSRLLNLLGVVLGLVLVAALSALLLYQLWLRQWVKFDDVGRFENTMQLAIEPLAERLAIHNIELPVRRNLNELELVSARTETHPTRPSTTLLRVSLINQADIAQPLPWLELSLRDSEGQLVSRRKLPPRDYLYNNKTTASIGPNELKKVTIELLAFPKQVTGYELKIINR